MIASNDSPPDATALAESLYGFVHLLARRTLGRQSNDCEDLAHETALAILRRAHNYDARRAARTTWATWVHRSTVASRATVLRRTPSTTHRDSVSGGSSDDSDSTFDPPDRHADALEQYESIEHARDRLDALLPFLNARERTVIVNRFGLHDGEPMTLQEIGDRLRPRLTKERVRQIEFNALGKLRDKARLYGWCELV